jgi:hypothetical protein
MSEIVLDIGVLGIELPGSLMHIVPPFGDGETDNPAIGRSHFIDDFPGVPGRIQKIDDRTNDAGALASSTAFDYGVKKVLGQQNIADAGVMRQQPHPTEAPFTFNAEMQKVVRIHRLMRPMKPADSNMGDTLSD